MIRSNAEEATLSTEMIDSCCSRDTGKSAAAVAASSTSARSTKLIEGGAAAESPRRGAARLAALVCRAILDPHPFVSERNQGRKQHGTGERTETLGSTCGAQKHLIMMVAIMKLDPNEGAIGSIQHRLRTYLNTEDTIRFSSMNTEWVLMFTWYRQWMLVQTCFISPM